MSDTVTVNTEVEVNVYSVTDNYGAEESFSVDVDSDGDLLISVDTIFSEGLDECPVREWLTEDDNLEDVINNSCTQYSKLAFRLIANAQSDSVVWMAELLDWTRADVFVNELTPRQIEALREALK